MLMMCAFLLRGTMPKYHPQTHADLPPARTLLVVWWKVRVPSYNEAFLLCTEENASVVRSPPHGPLRDLANSLMAKAMPGRRHYCR